MKLESFPSIELNPFNVIISYFPGWLPTISANVREYDDFLMEKDEDFHVTACFLSAILCSTDPQRSLVGQWCHCDCLQVSYQAGCITVQQKEGSKLSENSATGFCAKRKLIFKMLRDKIPEIRTNTKTEIGPTHSKLNCAIPAEPRTRCPCWYQDKREKNPVITLDPFNTFRHPKLLCGQTSKP